MFSSWLADTNESSDSNRVLRFLQNLKPEDKNAFSARKRRFIKIRILPFIIRFLRQVKDKSLRNNNRFANLVRTTDLSMESRPPSPFQIRSRSPTVQKIFDFGGDFSEIFIKLYRSQSLKHFRNGKESGGIERVLDSKTDFDHGDSSQHDSIIDFHGIEGKCTDASRNLSWKTLVFQQKPFPAALYCLLLFCCCCCSGNLYSSVVFLDCFNTL